MRKKLMQAKEVEGRDKPIWLNVGAVFLKDDGSISGIKLEVLPLPDAKGEVWLRAFDEDVPDQKLASFTQGHPNFQDPWGNG